MALAKPVSHKKLHPVASHSDTTATGAELETLTNGSDSDSLHVHSIADTHIASTSNPHSVTASQVSLGSVNNSSTTNGLWEISGGKARLKTAVDVDFQKFQAIGMNCDRGATFPSTPGDSQWFRHEPIGRKILYMYDGSTWQPMFMFGAAVIYVDKLGSDVPDAGTATGASGFLTAIYALALFPKSGDPGASLTIYGGDGTFQEEPLLTAFEYEVTLNGEMTKQITGGTATGGTQLLTAVGSAHVKASLVDAGQSFGMGSLFDSGTTDGTSANKLIESGQNFLNTVKRGMIVKNTTDTTYATVTAIDSDNQLSLDTDIIVSGETYEIGWGEYRDHLIVTDDGDERQIYSNTDDTFFVIGRWDTTPNNTSVYDVLSYDTIFDAQDTRTTCFTITGCMSVIFYRIKTTDGETYDYLARDYSTITLTSCFVDGSISDDGQKVRTENYSSAVANECHIKMGDVGLRLQNVSTSFTPRTSANTWIESTNFDGVAIFNAGSVKLENCFIENCGRYSVWVGGRSIFDMNRTVLEGAGTYNLRMTGSSYAIIRNGGNEFENAGSHNINIDASSTLEMQSSTASARITNAGGWGINTLNKSLGMVVTTQTFAGNSSGTTTADASSTNT